MENVVQWKRIGAEVRKAGVVGSVQPKGPCDHASALVAAGHGTTDAAGRWTMDLRSILCDLENMPIKGVPSFVATPVQLAILTAAVNGPVVGVQAFSLSGAPAPEITFSWHVIVLSEAA